MRPEMIDAEKIEGISPLFSQGQGHPENIEKAPAGSVLSVPFGVGVNSCYCVGCEIIRGAAVLDKLLYGAAGGLGLRHSLASTLYLSRNLFACLDYSHPNDLAELIEIK